MSRADKVLRDIERMAEKKFLPIVGPGRGRVLAEVICGIRPKRVLEVGTLIGYSAVLMAKRLGSDAHLTTVEINADEARARARSSLFPGKVRNRQGSSTRQRPKNSMIRSLDALLPKILFS